MSLIAGIDYSTNAVDVVLLDEDSDRATWHRFELRGQDAFERARDVRDAIWYRGGRRISDIMDEAIAVGIEEPRGYNSGALYRVQGAILACLPRQVLVQPWVPSEWRKAVGLPGNAPKSEILRFVAFDCGGGLDAIAWPQDAYDAYCIALATRSALRHKEAA